MSFRLFGHINISKETPLCSLKNRSIRDCNRGLPHENQELSFPHHDPKGFSLVAFRRISSFLNIPPFVSRRVRDARNSKKLPAADSKPRVQRSLSHSSTERMIKIP
ncbi:hypothetical protein EVA_02287 [gut metagenome]|uniref:Uncharacterized protein n=1 Tax=gut metagenome TaxID=749906 RepID=J9GNE5_9ZZZZ